MTLQAQCHLFGWRDPVAGDQKLTFSYDGLGRRIRKQVYEWDISSGTYLLTADWLFVYDGWNMIAEVAQKDLQTAPFPRLTSYTWGLDLSGSLQGAGGVGGLLAVAATNSSGTLTYMPAYDFNGNVMGYFDTSTETLVAEFEYGPFGELIRATGEKKDLFSFRFSTKYEDTETGLLYYGYRYYDPETGRWLSRDPIGENGGLNLYGMVGNDPVNFFDVLGLSDPATLSRAISTLTLSIKQCKCCPEVAKLLEARLGDIFYEIDDDALDHLINYTNQFSEKASEYVDLSESITDPVDKALLVVDFLQGGYNIEFHEGAVDAAGKISSNLDSVSKNIKKLGLVGKVTSQTAAIAKGDAISAALTIGGQLSPPGVSDFLDYYGEGYRASVEAIKNISFYSNAANYAYQNTGSLCQDDCDLAKIALKSALTGIR